MSRAFTLGVLAVLVACLGVISYIVTPKPPAPPTPEDVQKVQQAQQKSQEAEAENRTKMMEDLVAKGRVNPDALPPTESVKVPTKGGQRLPNPPVPTTQPGKRIHMQMLIENDWHKKRPDGRKGLEQLAKEVEQAKLEAEKMRAAAPARTTAPVQSVGTRTKQ